MLPDKPLILAFDTSAAQCAAALLCGDRILAETTEPIAKGQAERLVPLLEEILAKAGARWSDLSALAVCTGPGNFTGVRIAVSAARGLALALNIPAIGVSALEALAFGATAPTIAALDARRDRIFVQGFAGAVPTNPEQVETAALDQQDWHGHAFAGFMAEQLADRFGGSIHYAGEMVDPATLARCAATRLGTPQPRPAPLYLRPPDAALPKDPPPTILP